MEPRFYTNGEKRPFTPPDRKAEEEVGHKDQPPTVNQSQECFVSFP